MGRRASKGKQGKGTGTKGRFGSQMTYNEKREIRRLERERMEKVRKQALANARRRSTIAKKKALKKAEDERKAKSVEGQKEASGK